MNYNKYMEKQPNNDKVNEFTMTVRDLINTAISFMPFTFGNVRRLDINGKFIYLWQNAKGDVHYCFNLFEKEYYTTSAIKLGNVLTQHFGCEVDVVNNTKEQLKKMINATTGLNKALTNFDRHNSFANHSPQYKFPSSSNNTDSKVEITQLLQILDSNSDDTTSLLNLKQPQLDYNHNLNNQELLYEGVIQLSTYNLDSHTNTIYIKLNELPIVHKEISAPVTKQAFFTDNNGSNNKNKFIPTPWMVYQYYWGEPNQSFIILLILFMAKNDIYQALKILAWIADSLTSLSKLPFVLVLHSQADEYMKLFYEEIVEAFFHDFQCEKIESDNIDAKSLSENLDEKAIYNFHNITTPTILGEPAYELTNNLIHKDKCKINKKSVTTVANIIITSTSKYIPMINEEVPSAIVEVDSSIHDLCKHINIRPNKHILAKKIQDDLPNFVAILNHIDIQVLDIRYPVINHNITTNVLDGDVDGTEVFDSIIRDKNIVPFKSIAKTKTENKLVDEIDKNFKINRVDKAKLWDYFELLFGRSIYKSNNALILRLRKDYSNTGEPFDNLKTHVRTGRAYYFL